MPAACDPWVRGMGTPGPEPVRGPVPWIVAGRSGVREEAADAAVAEHVDADGELHAVGVGNLIEELVVVASDPDGRTN